MGEAMRFGLPLSASFGGLRQLHRFLLHDPFVVPAALRVGVGHPSSGIQGQHLFHGSSSSRDGVALDCY